MIPELIAGYLDGGCPCLYPRFRATVRRDTHNIAGAQFATAEQLDLVRGYIERVPLEGKTEIRDGWQATCARCGSAVLASGDVLVITKPAGTAELGAPVGRCVYRASAWLTPPPPARVKFLDQAFPQLQPDAWRAWMAEKRAT